MKERHINFVMILFSLIGGVVGFFVCDLLFMGVWMDKLPYPVSVGLYFGIISFFITVACLLAEMVKPGLTTEKWKTKYCKKSWLIMLPLTLVLVSVFSGLLQLLYQIDINISLFNQDMDYCLVVDNSGSMSSTDPSNERFAAAEQFIDKLSDSDRFAYIPFSDNAEVLVEMDYVDSADKKEKAIDAIYGNNLGMGTNYTDAIETAVEHFKDTDEDGRRSRCIIFVSDGEAYVDINSLANDCLKESVVVHTVAVSGASTDVLEDISDATGGTYHEIDNISDLGDAYRNIGTSNGNRLLIGERTGATRISPAYAVMRVLFIMLIGILISLIVGLMFDNKSLFINFMLGGILSGLLAGICLEMGFIIYAQSYNPDAYGFYNRLISVSLLAVLITVFAGVRKYAIENTSFVGVSGMLYGQGGLNGTDTTGRIG